MDFFPFDDEYVRRLRDGDRWTEEHFRSYFEQLLLIKLRRRLPSLEAIHDVRQEVFVRVFKTLRAPGGGIRDGRSSARTSIPSATTSSSSNTARTSAPSRSLDAHLDFPTSEDVEDALVNGEERERVRRVVNELPPRDRDILKALFFEERSKDDVCAEFGVDRGYLRVLLHRAKEKFRRAWGPQSRSPIRPDETDSPKPSLPN